VRGRLRNHRGEVAAKGGERGGSRSLRHRAVRLVGSRGPRHAGSHLGGTNGAHWQRRGRRNGQDGEKRFQGKLRHLQKKIEEDDAKEAVARRVKDEAMARYKAEVAAQEEEEIPTAAAVAAAAAPGLPL